MALPTAPCLTFPSLPTAQIVTLDMGLLVAGTKYRGEFEERLKKLMDEIKQNDDIILMIDEVRCARFVCLLRCAPSCGWPSRWRLHGDLASSMGLGWLD